MKKFLALVLATVMTLALGACGQTPAGTEATAATTTKTESAPDEARRCVRFSGLIEFAKAK